MARPPSRPERICARAWCFGLLCALAGGVSAQSLPPHAPLRILIVSDEVNPHGLTPAELTQPGEIAAALAAAPALNLAADAEALLEIPTNEIEQATSRLAPPRGTPGAYDVLVYFAHRIPNAGSDTVVRQEAFVTAVDAFLVNGGGVVSFHHGIYRTAGKESMQALLRGEATGAVRWNTSAGQNVINVAPGHFVTTHGVAYPGALAYADPARGVAAGTYDAFNNTPDERYPVLELLPGPGSVTLLFASDYNEASTRHVLGYEHTRSTWRGAVVVYQPGEYQPNAFSGNNFQILLNAIVHVAARGAVLFADGFE